MSFGTATPKIAKAGVLMLSWVALGLLIVGTIAGSDYCDEADDNTVNFSYKWAKDFGTSEKTAVLVRELVRYYAYCPKLEYGSQQNTTFMLLSILGEEVPNTMSSVTSAYGEIRRRDQFDSWVNCSSANLTFFSSIVDKCCSVTKLDDRITEVVEDVCDVLILADCPTINEVYHDLIGTSMCDGVFTEVSPPGRTLLPGPSPQPSSCSAACLATSLSFSLWQLSGSLCLGREAKEKDPSGWTSLLKI
ncbi:hypothetical protein CYMTET_30724 [Cymbomonas tetramitiformis]|uniref:Uncharacterized protein n=1 Tax=Cymbomonas tetramitiformis TaxID=36881 RepID=A0AAE0FIX8_9CHLO|nr:hypothetical protein CYMTET_30724 [Cymbomonas tetramitiformis]